MTLRVLLVCAVLLSSPAFASDGYVERSYNWDCIKGEIQFTGNSTVACIRPYKEEECPYLFNWKDAIPKPLKDVEWMERAYLLNADGDKFQLGFRSDGVVVWRKKP